MQFLIEQNITECVKKYCENVLRNPAFYEKDEGYKYKAVATFKKEFNLNASGLSEMLERSLSDAINLVESGQYFPKKMLLKFSSKDSNFVRDQLKKLLKEDSAAGYRIDRFVEEMRARFPLHGKKHYFDYRFLSFFLAASMPEKYFYVKLTEYLNFAAIVGYKVDPKGSAGQKYETLSQISSMLREVLKRNRDFVKVHKLIASKFSYKDPSLSWGTFDFIFNVVRRDDSGAYTDAKKHILWNSRIAELKQEVAEDFIASEEVEGEISGITLEELLKQASEFKPSGKEGYKKTPSTRKVRLDNARQKERIRKIENYSCQVCDFSFEYINSKGKKRKYVEIDHIIDKAYHGTEVMGNLWALCPNCHVKKTLGVITIDPKAKKVTENGKEINIRDHHLDLGKSI